MQASVEATQVEPRAVGEHRWPMAAAVSFEIVLTLFLPSSVLLGPNWLVPLVEGVLLGTLIIEDPGRINRRSNRLRWLSIALVAILVSTTVGFTVRLVYELIHGGAVTDSAGQLLLAGNIVWISMNIAFALLYWELDGGGPPARLHRMRDHADFAFPLQLNPLPGWEGWRPRFVDYLYLGFTNATAFSPTDVMPLAPWAKMTMMAQSFISLAILGLVIARAANIFA